TLSQSRFLSSGVELTEEEKAQVWTIPLSVLKTDGTVAGTIVLTEPRQILTLPCEAEEFLKLNAGYKTLARINYPDEVFEKIKESLLKGALSQKEFVVDRAGLINDAYAFARAGKLDTTTVLSLLESFTGEKEYLVWLQITDTLLGISSILKENSEDGFNSFSCRILENIVSDVGWDAKENETFEDSLKRPVVLGVYGRAGDINTVDEARRRFQENLKTPGSLHPDLFGFAVNLIARNGDSKTFDDLLGHYRKARKNESIEEMVRLLSAMALFKQKDVIEKSLEFMLTDDEVRGQDMIYFVRGISDNKFAIRIAWEFFKANAEEIMKEMGSELHVGAAAKAICSGFSSAEEAVEVEEYFKQNPVPKTSQ
ncbi:unnamed protein product, partial [marine sediment metagenome]